MNKKDALKEVFSEKGLTTYMRINKHRFLKGILQDKTSSAILKKKGYKMTQQEQWEKKSSHITKDKPKK